MNHILCCWCYVIANGCIKRGIEQEKSMNEQALVAVITRTKDRDILLKRAIESVLNQTSESWWHVIVNDGGSPEPVNELVAEYTARYKGRLTVIHHESSKGMEAASNSGIMASDSKYVVIHDDDDSWEPTFVERCLQEFDQCSFPSVKGVITHTTQIFESLEGRTVTEERRQEFDSHLTAVSLPQITEINKFMPISFMYERNVFDEIGLYDDTLPVIGDWEFNIRFIMKYDVVVVKECLANYHIRTNSPPKYSNTVTAGQDAHLFYRALITNKHMRADLEAGRLTAGTLFAYGDYFYRIGGNLWRLGRILDKIKSLSPVNLIRKLLNK
ncbi:MAG: glycosyltransferase family 2 protein [Gammaproteobacteria bacterium]|nr:MAG: glycosyltransferase family 2 protein [Gammaproteobacteria bacterium]